ncbi:MAG TPA: hypothetical protein DCQ51_19535 [Planktothrix sp. UBA8407]|nr:hypothetical protein [Planktothrix sp. UBA8407]
MLHFEPQDDPLPKPVGLPKRLTPIIQGFQNFLSRFDWAKAQKNNLPQEQKNEVNYGYSTR